MIKHNSAGRSVSLSLLLHLSTRIELNKIHMIVHTCCISPWRHLVAPLVPLWWSADPGVDDSEKRSINSMEKCLRLNKIWTHLKESTGLGKGGRRVIVDIEITIA